MQVKVREIKDTDWEAICALQPRNNPEAIKTSIANDLETMSRGDLKRLVLEIDGVVAGQAIFERLGRFTRWHRVRVTDVVVAGKYQGMSLCSRLFAVGEEWARSLPGVTILELSVRGGIKAEQIYLHYGFEEFGRLSGGVKEAWEGGLTYDEVYLYKKLK